MSSGRSGSPDSVTFVAFSPATASLGRPVAFVADALSSSTAAARSGSGGSSLRCASAVASAVGPAARAAGFGRRRRRGELRGERVGVGRGPSPRYAVDDVQHLGALGAAARRGSIDHVSRSSSFATSTSAASEA